MLPASSHPEGRVSAPELHGVAQTCLIPLGVRAEDAGRARPVLGDRRAREVAERIDADWKALRLPEASARAALVRAREIDRYVESFLAKGGKAVVVSIGSGLDTRIERLPTRPDAWFDLELPEVAALRRALIPDAQPATTLAGSFLEPGWLGAVRPRTEGARVLLIAEGVLNYIPAAALAMVLKETATALGSYMLIADVMSGFFATTARFLGALRKTGAGIAWGASSPDSCARLLGVQVTALHRYLRPGEPALGPSRHIYRLPVFRDMSRLLEADLGARGTA